MAYSGGVDSTLVMKIAHVVLGDRVLAVTASSPLYPASEAAAAERIVAGLGIRHMFIESNELLVPGFIDNPRNRCYLCKKELFGSLSRIAGEQGLNYILDGSNASDIFDVRPGKAAAKESGVRSVLEEVGLEKKQVQELAKRLGLSNWDKPSAACLASRFPYGQPITKEALRMVETAEEYLIEMGISQVRVRHYNHLCRIEVDKHQIQLCLENQQVIVDKLKGIGYTFVTLDLEGYRTGSMNEE